ncbi:MAG TPA: phosphoadenylyl-sulfate reductase [Acidobacteriota bacterium]|nr:phosphoadenylyl-sulfate reductase [Acidobacteriota bacterium]
MSSPSTLKLTTPPAHEDCPPQQLVKWSLERFQDQRLVLTTGLGMEGCVLIDLYARQQAELDVIYLDTGFFFPQTHRLLDRLKVRYPHLNFINKGTPLTPQDQAELYGDELWKRDPDLCCRLRKVVPMEKALADVDVWVTGLRRGQSAQRANLRQVEWNWKYQVVKISPLAYWTRKQVRRYVDENGVPYNQLHDRGFPSIGCTHCTRRVEGLSGDEYSRRGRWSGSEKTECGLHT